MPTYNAIPTIRVHRYPTYNAIPTIRVHRYPTYNAIPTIRVHRYPTLGPTATHLGIAPQALGWFSHKLSLRYLRYHYHRYSDLPPEEAEFIFSDYLW
jgi:hypothetical protein